MEQKKFSTRIVMGDRFAFLPSEEIAASKIPAFGEAKVKVLASPGIGGNFVEYLIELRKDEGTIEPLAEKNLEYFTYILGGKISVSVEAQPYHLFKGDYLFIPPGINFSMRNVGEQVSKLLLFKKRYTPLGSGRPAFIYGNEASAREEVDTLFNGLFTWKILLPDDVAYDVGFRIGLFPPGVGFDSSEIHFEEHGLYVLNGQGLYLLGESWIPYREGDFIYMGPYVSQSVYATGTEKTRYLISKNLHRDIQL